MRAKKSFGQHFLHNEGTAVRIAGSLRLVGEVPRILEVGPGKGMLTKYLMDGPADFRAVEADADMVAYLAERYPGLAGKVLSGDFLRLDLGAVFGGGQPFLLIGNFPYNISSQIVFRMLEHRGWIPEMVGMFQREMAVRIVAPPGGKDYGIISVLVQAWYRGEYLFTVGNRSFSPPPKVQSAVIRLTRLEQGPACDERLFTQVVRQAFGQRRKMLRNTMKVFFRDPAILAEPFFTLRPEVLTVADFVALTNRIEQEGGQEAAPDVSGRSK